MRAHRSRTSNLILGDYFLLPNVHEMAQWKAKWCETILKKTQFVNFDRYSHSKMRKSIGETLDEPQGNCVAK